MAMNLDKFEKYPLTYGPTPIEYLPRLTEAIGADVEVYAKRDDCILSAILKLFSM